MKFSPLDGNFIIGIWWVKSIWRWHQLLPVRVLQPLWMLWLVNLLKSSGFIKNLANPQKTCKDLNADSFDPYETLLLPLCPSQNNVHHTVKLVSDFFARVLKMPVSSAPVCQDSAGLLTKLGKCMIYLIKILCKFKQVGETWLHFTIWCI